jgi:hypothetical protein
LPGALLLGLNWLLPGLGFVLCRRHARGLTQFLIVIVTFALGLAWHGGVDWPSWLPSAPDFNLINNFTFLIQLGMGLPAILSLLANLSTGLATTLHLGFLAGTPTHPYYELGVFYMIVAGAINYFATCNLYDRIIHPNPRFAEQEGLTEKESSEQE